MKKKHSQVYKFLKSYLDVIKSARIPYYSSKYSNHIYTQHQHLAILCLMKYMKQHYRDIVDLLAGMDRFSRLLKLKIIPHFTTLQKFFKRFSQVMFDLILFQSVKLFQLSTVGAAIDATGYDDSYSSRYYSVKIKGSCYRKYYPKDSIAIDVSSYYS